MSDGASSVRERPRQRCVRSSATEHAALRRRARAAGRNLSRYLVERALADAAAPPPEAGSEEERRALRDALLEAVEALSMLRRELPGCGGLTLLGALEILARERAR